MDTCHNCRYFLSGEHEQGLCRRYPPLPILSGGQLFSQFPILLMDGWCGEFKEKEHQ